VLVEVESSGGSSDVTSSDNEISEVLSIVSLGRPLLDHGSKDGQDLRLGDALCVDENPEEKEQRQRSLFGGGKEKSDEPRYIFDRRCP